MIKRSFSIVILLFLTFLTLCRLGYKFEKVNLT